jgi:hypothetical protein
MHSIITLMDVFSLWDSLVQLATDIGESQWTVIKWKKRNNIPTRYWQSLCDAAKRRSKRLTVEDLMRVHATRSTSIHAAGSRASAG